MAKLARRTFVLVWLSVLPALPVLAQDEDGAKQQRGMGRGWAQQDHKRQACPARAAAREG